MAKKQNPKTGEPGWITIRQAVDLTGRTDTGVRRSFVPLLPPEAIVAEPTPCHIHLPTLIDVLIDRARESVVGTDPMAGVASPALEEWRKHKAALAKLDLQERRGDVIHFDRVKDSLQPFFDTLQRFADRSSRRYGREFSDDWNRAWKQATDALATFLQEHPAEEYENEDRS